MIIDGSVLTCVLALGVWRSRHAANLRVPEDEFLILASDGVWDVMDNPGIVSFLQMEVKGFLCFFFPI